MTGNCYVGPEGAPDKYRLLRLVGSGGEAELWKAELTVAGGTEPVAVKILRPDHGGDFAQLSARWSEQAELLRFVRHPGVIGVREHFEAGPMHHAGGTIPEPRTLYLVMNWVEGVALREWMMERQGMDASLAALQLLEQVASALDLLHSGRATPGGRPLVHGDISPGNVMIDAEGQAVLVDFGLVRATGHKTSAPMGTLGYAAPETWTVGEYSPAADRYSFGAVAHFALIGNPPPRNPHERRALLGTHPLLANRTPADVERLLTIYSPNPTDRPPTALEWIRSLRAAGRTTRLARPPVPPPNWNVPNPQTGRRSWVVVALTVLLVLAGVGTTVTAWRQASDPLAPAADGTTIPGPPPTGLSSGPSAPTGGGGTQVGKPVNPAPAECSFNDAGSGQPISAAKGSTFIDSLGNSYRVGDNCELTKVTSTPCSYNDAGSGQPISAAKGSTFIDSLGNSYRVGDNCELIPA